MNAYLKRENKTCLPPTELQKTTKQMKKRRPEMQHCLCLMAKGRTYFLSSSFWLWKAQRSTMCSEVEEAP